MNLTKIIENLKIINIVGNTDIEVPNISYDSRKISKGDIFVCLKGYDSDGHNFISQALDSGASAIVVEKEVKASGATIIQVQNTRIALAHMSANFFEHPEKLLSTIAITGTKGKTTTSFMIKSILECAGLKVGLIGTLGVVLDEDIIPLNNTTPESYEIYKYLNKMVENGCKYAVIEASSIGLANHRLDGLNFDIGIFTNISHDHIGPSEHVNYDEYLKSKSLLFKRCNIGIVNTDDKSYSEIIKNNTCKIIKKFSLNSCVDYYAQSLKLINENGNLGIKFSLRGNINLDSIFVAIPGDFNAYNSLSAIGASDCLGISKECICEGLKNVKVKGRFEAVPNSRNYSIFIDYAHNAISMENILKTIKKYSPNRIIVLFGAGGNRPKIRRYEMGEICGKLSDLSVITSDNPRFENPLDIIEDIKLGINKTSGKYTIIPDRKEAIEFCLKTALEGDVVILAGKGHEEYQEIKGVKYPFDERKIVYKILERLDF